MSKKHPIVVVTGSSGAGTSSVKRAFEEIFRSQALNPATIEGDCFHRFDRSTMDMELMKARAEGLRLTHFGPEGNLFEELEAVFREYGDSGSGKRRYYIHNDEEAARHGHPPGSLTPWEPLPENTDLLFYEGLHGGIITDSANIYQHVDLLIGVAPIINLEWIQKIHRDKAVRGYSAQDATAMILNRMHDYVHYVVPQFSRTDINFQRIPTVDTANPFSATDIPSDDQSYCVIHIRKQKKVPVDYRYLLEMLEGSFMSAADTIVIPAGKKAFAMQLIITPVIYEMMAARGA